jgi:LmbE family N-acetylglucosaminyl deacetylase
MSVPPRGAPALRRAQPEDVLRLGTVVGVWAHPGDETFLSAGLMALARAAGDQVVVVSATRGEHGTADAGRWPPERLARLRSDELAASLAVLGVTRHRWLDFPDGGCPEASARTATQRLAAILAEVAPDTIVTYGPDGLTGDRDHRAVSGWTTAAWRAGAAQARLLHVSAPADAPAVRLRLEPAVLTRKAAALRAQASQVSRLHSDAGCQSVGPWWRVEAFRDAEASATLDQAPNPHPVPTNGFVPRPFNCLMRLIGA